jgi:hypothetical protein
MICGVVCVKVGCFGVEVSDLVVVVATVAVAVVAMVVSTSADPMDLEGVFEGVDDVWLTTALQTSVRSNSPW